LIGQVGPNTTNALTLEKNIVASQPILEAFGNAKTVRVTDVDFDWLKLSTQSDLSLIVMQVMNMNSSRFGKYLELKLSEGLAVCV
jgi:myosin heavy subunit